MLSKEFIDIEKTNLRVLGEMLHKEAVFARQFIDSGKRPKTEMDWFNAVSSACVYGTFLIKNLIDSIDSYTDKPEEQIGFYIGKIAIQSFLDIINAFEKSTNDLVEKNDQVSALLKLRISKKVNIIEEGWQLDAGGKSKKMKCELIKSYERKIFEMNFIRETFRQNGIIDELDKRILDFAWDVRNSMHANFLAIKDIEFSAPGTSLNYSFRFKKGQELYHPEDLLSFYTMTRQIIFIQLKILQHFNVKQETENVRENT